MDQEAQPTANHALTITREFNTPRRQLWEAWTDPQAAMKWWGPKDYTSPKGTIDLRVGGSYLLCMRSPEGADFWSTGTYREVVPMERLVYTDSFADEQGHVVSAAHYGMDSGFPLELLVTLTFEDRGNHSRLTLRHSGFTTAEAAQQTEAGWNESLDKLAASLA